MAIKDMNIRFFIDTYEDSKEVTEAAFLHSGAPITYERHTIHTNGVRQVCLTKIEEDY